MSRCCAREFKLPWRLLPSKPLSLLLSHYLLLLLLLLPLLLVLLLLILTTPAAPLPLRVPPQKPLSSLPRNQRLKPTQISPLSSSGPIIISIQPSAGHDDRFPGHDNRYPGLDDRYPVHATTTGYMLIDSSFLLFGSKLAPLKQTPIFQSSHGWLPLFKEGPDASRNFLRFSNGRTRAGKASNPPIRLPNSQPTVISVSSATSISDGISIKWILQDYCHQKLLQATWTSLSVFDWSPFQGSMIRLGVSGGLLGSQQLCMGHILGNILTFPDNPFNLVKFLWSKMAWAGVQHIHIHVLCSTCISGGHFRPSKVSFCRFGRHFYEAIFSRLIFSKSPTQFWYWFLIHALSCVQVNKDRPWHFFSSLGPRSRRMWTKACFAACSERLFLS